MDERKPVNQPPEKSDSNAAPTQNTPSMEVHHHAHAEAHGEKKKIRHYFFEFFMLFLAVFAGSVAEYYLEHVVEHKREKQYIESMIEDLKVDTSGINSVTKENKILMKGLDTLISILDTPAKLQGSTENVSRLYIFNGYTTSVATMEFSTRTLSQLKNAGNMRLIRDVKVSDSIMNYDQYIQMIGAEQKAYMDLSLDALKAAFQIFDSRLLRAKGIHSRHDFMARPNKLLTNDTLKLIQYDNMVETNRAVISAYVEMLDEQKQRAVNLIAFLKREYDL